MKRYEKSLNQLTLNRKSISLSAYRAIFIVKLLEENPQSFEDLISHCQNNPILDECPHKDTITNSINSLRECGFEIEKPKPSNNFKFKLLTNPFKLFVSENQSNIMYSIRNSLYYYNDYEIIFKLNSAYNKIKALTADTKKIEVFERSNYLKEIDLDILQEILEACEKKSTLQIIYNSPINGKEKIKVKAEKVVLENNKLYLWLYSYKYKSAGFYRIDRISKINKLSDDATPIFLTNSVKYRLWGEAAKKFIPNQNEIITEKLKGSITVQANVINKFNFFQRLLAFSEECVILEPEIMKNEFISHLSKMLEVNNA